MQCKIGIYLAICCIGVSVNAFAKPVDVCPDPLGKMLNDFIMVLQKYKGDHNASLLGGIQNKAGAISTTGDIGLGFDYITPTPFSIRLSIPAPIATSKDFHQYLFRLNNHSSLFSAVEVNGLGPGPATYYSLAESQHYPAQPKYPNKPRQCLNGYRYPPHTPSDYLCNYQEVINNSAVTNACYDLLRQLVKSVNDFNSDQTIIFAD